MNERITKKKTEKTKIKIRIADESKLDAESIKDRLEDLSEKLDSAKVIELY